MSRYLSLGSRDLLLSLQAFPGGFPTRLSYSAVTRATEMGVDPRRESQGSAGKHVPLEWTETSGGLFFFSDTQLIIKFSVSIIIFILI